MPLVTRKEFAALANITEIVLNRDFSRLKLSHLPGNKKQMDTENPINAAYIQQKELEVLLGTREKPVLKAPKYIKIKDRKAAETGKTGAKTPTEPKEIGRKIAMQTARDQKRVDQDVEKKGMEIERMKLTIQREEHLLAKSMGKLLPIEMVEGIIKRHASSFLKSFEKGVENIASIHVNILAGGDQTKKVRVMEDCRRELSRCITEAGESAKLEIEQLIEDFSETLLRGQKRV